MISSVFLHEPERMRAELIRQPRKLNGVALHSAIDPVFDHTHAPVHDIAADILQILLAFGRELLL